MVKRKSSLIDQIEKSQRQDDSVDNNPEDFVPGLISEIARGVGLPKVDLRSKASAKEAVLSLSQQVEKLKNYQSRVKSLKTILEDKRDQLEKD